MIFYHVVTERPMSVGQKIRFDAEHVSGVSARVARKLPAVREIYAHPEAYRAETIEHHTSVALRETAIEDVRRSQYPMLPSRLACLYGSRTLEEARKWASLFVEWGRPTYAIVKMEGERCFIGDATKCFSGRERRAAGILLSQ